MITRLIWKLFKTFKRIKRATCLHYYRYDGIHKTLIFKRSVHMIECDDCGCIKKFDDEKQALHRVEKSQNRHGANYRKLRNGLYDGGVDVVKMDFGN